MSMKTIAILNQKGGSLKHNFYQYDKHYVVKVKMVLVEIKTHKALLEIGQQQPEECPFPVVGMNRPTIDRDIKVSLIETLLSLTEPLKLLT